MWTVYSSNGRPIIREEQEGVVTEIIAGVGTLVSPTSGQGAVTVSASATPIISGAVAGGTGIRVIPLAGVGVQVSATGSEIVSGTIFAGSGVLVYGTPGGVRIDAAGAVSSVSAGTGIRVSPTTGAVIVSATGSEIISGTIVAGTNITVERTAGVGVTIASTATGSSTPAIAVADRTAGDVTTTSNSLIDLTGATVTMTTGAHRALLGFTAAISSAVAQNIYVTWLVDGTNQAGTDGWPGSAGNRQILSLMWLSDVLSAGSHTFKIQWRVNTASAGTVEASGSDKFRIFAVEQGA